MTRTQKNANLISTVNEIATIARNRGIAHLFTQDQQLSGRVITLKDRPMIHFGSCSYLGLEFDSRLQEAGIQAIQRYGSQFSCSRTYVSLGIYEELESLLGTMFGRPVILSTSSTMGHQAVVPIIIEDQDAVILDQQAHVSMQEAVSKLQLKGVTVTVLRHNRLDDLQKKYDELSVKHNRVWYFIDGIYSMYGDCAPLVQLKEMLELNKKMYLYVDDAHGMSWVGEHGSGFTRSIIQHHSRMVLATSLAKGFASAGGVFVLPDEEMYWKVKNWGGPLTYSGPQQPAVIGSSVASAKIHLSDEIYTLQNSLQTKIQFCNEVIAHYDLPVVADSNSPIFFIGLGLTKVGYNMVRRLSDDGYYANLGIFPAVPETCTGVRFTITNHHTESDIEGLAERLYYHLPKALKEEGRTMNDVYRAFKSLSGSRISDQKGESKVVSLGLRLQHENNIEMISKETWNSLMADRGSFDWNGLKLLEESFSENSLPEDNWGFHYYLVYDKNDIPVLATFFTSMLAKDDMLAPSDVSERIEKMRVTDPYHLTSKTFMMGSLLTDGDHLYLDKTHPDWQKALSMLLDEVWAEQEREKASMLYLRDFPESDLELRDYFIDQGFVKMNIPDAHYIDNRGNWDSEEYVNKLTHKRRYHIRKDVLKLESNFELQVVESYTNEEIDHWYSLYENVRSRNLEINIFKLPKKLFYNMAKSTDWDVLVLNLKEHDAEGPTVAVGFACKAGGNYCPLVLGIDYAYLQDFKIYKQILYKTVLRGLELNSNRIYLGLTASLEKRKTGAVAVKQVAYVQMKDHYNMMLIGMIPNTKQLVS
jgi:7-keto-8-aminopelargonate synthetase-like enzyme